MKYFIIILIIFSLSTSIYIYSKQISKPPKITTQKQTSPNTFNKKLKIIFVTPMIGHPVWLESKYGMEAAAKEFGFKTIWMGADDHNLKKTIAELRNAIDTLPDGIITCPFVSKTFTPMLTKAKKLKIPVTVVAVDAESPELRTSFIGTNSLNAGLLQIQSAHKKVGDNMNIGIFMSSLDAGNQILQVKAINDYIVNFPDAKIVSIKENLADKMIAKEKFAEMIDEFPEMNVLIGTEGAGASAYGELLAERNLTNNITVITMDDTKENLNILKEGKIYGLIAQDFYKMGYLGAKYAFLAVNNEPVPKVVDSGVTLITIKNIETYKNKPELR